MVGVNLCSAYRSWLTRLRPLLHAACIPITSFPFTFAVDGGGAGRVRVVERAADVCRGRVRQRRRRHRGRGRKVIVTSRIDLQCASLMAIARTTALQLVRYVWLEFERAHWMDSDCNRRPAPAAAGSYLVTVSSRDHDDSLECDSSSEFASTISESRARHASHFPARSCNMSIQNLHRFCSIGCLAWNTR